MANETTQKNEFQMLTDHILYIMDRIQDIQDDELRDYVAMTCGLATGFAARALSAEKKLEAANAPPF